MEKELNVMSVFAIIIMSVFVMSAHATGKIKLSCIGNSITAGYGITDVNGNYPSRLQKLLGNGYEVQNDGVSGTTLLKKGDNSYWKNGNLGRALAFKPDIVTIKLGTNDTKPQNWDSHHDEFRSDYLSMIDTLNTLLSKPDIFLVVPVPVFETRWGINDSVLKLIIVIVKEIAVERNLPVIDANTPLLEFSKYFSDGIHPNTAGADTIAHVIYRALLAATDIAPKNGMKSTASIDNKEEGRYDILISFSNGRFLSGPVFDPAGRQVHCFGGSGRAQPVCTGIFIQGKR
jgi:lysophospholipase L1-like esterase